MKKLLSSLALAFMTLTRLPMPFASRVRCDDNTLTASAVFFPLVGLFYGALSWWTWNLSAMASAPSELKALLLLALPYALNKFFHLDGLSDVADAYFADRSPAERLAILKDPHVGSFAVGTVVLYLLAKYILLKLFVQWSYAMWPLLALPVFTRYGMVLLASISRYPREKGTAGYLIGRIPRGVVFASIALFFACLVPAYFIGARGPLLLALMAFTVFGALLFRAWSMKKIGGVTGDGLGAFHEILDLSLLAAVLAVCSRKGWV